MSSYDIEVFKMMIGGSADSETMKYAIMVMESDNMPIKNKMGEAFFKSIQSKSNIDFGTIPNSKGNFKDWESYPTLLETMQVLDQVIQKKNPLLVAKMNIINDAMENIASLSPNYMKGFAAHSSYVMTEYNALVLTVVNAISSIIYNYGDYIKSLKDGAYEIKISPANNKTSEFYFAELEKFNKLMQNSGMEYRKMIDSIANSDRNNFTGVELLGIAAVAAMLFSVVPITRELVYHFYKFKNSLSDSLEMQAKFLEMNKACVEANESLNVDKQAKVIAKQEKLSKTLHSIAAKLRVNSTKASRDSNRELQNDNKAFTIDEIKKDISNSPIELL